MRVGEDCGEVLRAVVRPRAGIVDVYRGWTLDPRRRKRLAAAGCGAWDDDEVRRFVAVAVRRDGRWVEIEWE